MWPLVYDYSGVRCIRYSLIIFSFLFVLSGITLIIIGATIGTINDEFSHFLPTGFFSPAMFLLVIGFVIFIMAILGCFSGFRESTCLIMSFGLLLGVISLFQIGVGVIASSLMGSVDEDIQDKLRVSMTNYNDNVELRDALDNLQIELRCCGINGPKDWENMKLWDGSLPNSCCLSFKNGTCENTSNVGCRFVLKLINDESSKILISSSYLLAFMEGFGMFFAFYLGKLLRQQKLARDYRRWLVRDQMTNSKTLTAGASFQDFPTVLF